MRQFKSVIQSLTTEPDGVPKLRLSLPPEIALKPGQVLSGFRTGDRAPYRHAFHPILIERGSWISHRSPDPGWAPGDTLSMLGPVGAGFSAPKRSRRWLLLSLAAPSHRLDPLIAEGLRSGRELALWVSQGAALPPPQVEVLAELESAADWADYLAVVCSLERLDELTGILTPFARAGRTSIQVLLDLDLPCGFGACGACAVSTTTGHSFACLDGPVYFLDDLRT